MKRVILALASVLLMPFVHAQVPGTLSYQGILVDNTGATVADGTHYVQFRFYDASSAGTLKYASLGPGSGNAVTTYKGMFTFVIGSGSVGNDPIPTDATNPLYIGGGAIWVELKVDGQTLAPRIPLTTVPNAYHAHNANRMDAAGLASGFIPAARIQAGSIDNTKLVTGTITSNEIADGTIAAADLAASGVTANTYGSASQVPVITVDSKGRITGATTAAIGGGTVTTVSASSPISITNPTTTPAISMTQAGAATNGFLSTTDWNTFNNKLGAATVGAGDVTGTFGATTVARIRGITVNATAPTLGQVLRYMGTDWVPTTIPTANGSTSGFLSNADWTTFNDKLSGMSAAGGDLTGTFGGLTVARIRGTNVNTTAPTTGQVLQYNGTDWIPTSIATGGVTAVSTTAPLSVTNPTTTPGLSISQATGSTNGFLSSTDWTTFNNKLGTGSAAAGDLTGTFGANTVARIRGTNVNITALATGQSLLYNGTDWVNATFGGDISGALNNATVARIRGTNVNGTAPTTGQALAFNGTDWIPTSHGGDISGALNNTTVAKIRGVNVNATSPTTNQVLQYNGTDWIPTTLSGGITTASNGLTAAAGNVTLGGTLTGNTTLNTGAFNLIHSGTGLNTVRINNAYTGGGEQTGLLVDMTSPTGTGTKFAAKFDVAETPGTSSSWGGLWTNVASVGSGAAYGINAGLTASAANTGLNYGVRSSITNNGSGFSYGILNSISANGTSFRIGISNQVASGASNTSNVYGLENYVDNLGSGYTYGFRNSITTIFSGNPSYGIYNSLGGDLTIPSGDVGILTFAKPAIGSTLPVYGVYSNVGGAETGASYAMYARNDATGSGTKYGIFTTGETVNAFSGKIGIGTTSPASKLDVEGGLSVGATYSGTTAAPTNGLIVEGSVGVGMASPTRAIVEQNGVVGSTAAIFGGNTTGIGLTALSTAPAVGFNTYTNAGTKAIAGGFGGSISFNTTTGDWSFLSSNASGAANSTLTMYTPMYIKNSLVGINSINPQSRLSVDGGLAVGTAYASTFVAPTNGAIVEGNVGLGTSTVINKLDVEGGAVIGATYSGTNTAPANGLLVQGNLGIGTTSTLNKLDVEGGAVVGATYSGTNTAPTNGLLVEGNVGIGVTSTTNKLEVSGTTLLSGVTTISENVVIPAAKNYTYATAKTQYMIVGYSNFEIANTAVTSVAKRHNGGTPPTYVATTGGTAGISAMMVAPVQLPEGATITTIEAFVIDSDATGGRDASVSLVRHTWDNVSVPSTIVSTATLGNVGQVKLTMSAVGHVVDNVNYSYFLTFGTFESDNLIGIYNVRFTYTVTKVD